MAQLSTSHRARISPTWCKDPLHRPSPGVLICPLSPRTHPAIDWTAYVARPFPSQTKTRGRGNASSRPHLHSSESGNVARVHLPQKGMSKYPVQIGRSSCGTPSKPTEPSSGKDQVPERLNNLAMKFISASTTSHGHSRCSR